VGAAEGRGRSGRDRLASPRRSHRAAAPGLAPARPRQVLARDLFAGARIDRFAYDVEILALARARGIPIAEIPVLWYNSPESKVSVVRDLFPTLRDLVRIRWRARRQARRHNP
jgi:hypothetical protein